MPSPGDGQPDEADAGAPADAAADAVADAAAVGLWMVEDETLGLPTEDGDAPKPGTTAECDELGEIVGWPDCGIAHPFKTMLTAMPAARRIENDRTRPPRGRRSPPGPAKVTTPSLPSPAPECR
jgi:hypothetical protein